MMLYVHAVAGAGRGFDASFESVTARCDEVPIKDYASAGQRRRFGKLAKLMYVAASRALSDPQVTNPQQLPIITGTALGEATVSLELLVQIHETAGVGISPSLVPNSVHNSPAGYLTIGLSNRLPSATVSQGWLSAPAALVAAQDYLLMGLADQVLVVVGDEADPAWIDRLEACGASDLSAALRAEALQESAVALVVGLRPCERDRGTLRGGVFAAESASTCFSATLASWGVELRHGDPLYLQGDPLALRELEAAAVKAGALPLHLRAGIGTCGGQALGLLAVDSKERERGFVYAAAERRELGILQYCAARAK